MNMFSCMNNINPKVLFPVADTGHGWKGLKRIAMSLCCVRSVTKASATAADNLHEPRYRQ